MDQFSMHAHRRMGLRGISEETVQLALDYGRTYYARGAVFKVVGRKEIERHSDKVDLRNLDGIHVVCSHSGCVMTVYRNRTFHDRHFRKPRYRRSWRVKGVVAV